MSNRQWPDEAPVFERFDGIVYVGVDVSHGHLFLMCESIFIDRPPIVYDCVPVGLGRNTKPCTPAARAMLAIARGDS